MFNLYCAFCHQEIQKNKFCSKSCAAKFNNTKKPKRSKTKICKNCETLILRSRTYCPNCNPNKQKYTNEQFIKAVQESQSINQVLSKLGVKHIRNFNKKIQELNITTNHFLGKSWLKGKTHTWGKSIPLEEILIEKSTYTSQDKLKKRLIKKNILTNKCYICGQLPIWNNHTLALQIDHINGINDDNRIENLRILCPNCHSQTNSYSGKNHGKAKNTHRSKKRRKQFAPRDSNPDTLTN